MLLRVLLMAILGIAAVFGFRLWRKASSLHAGGISGFELGEITKLAKGSKRIEAALVLRGKFVMDSEGELRGQLISKVDDSIRRLVAQEKLRREIEEALAGVDDAKIVEEIAEAEMAQSTASTASERAALEEKLELYRTHREQAKRLGHRATELDDAADRILLQLRNLQLALLEASSSAHSAGSDHVESALSALEEASEELRRQTQAEDEIRRIVRSSAMTETDRSSS